MELIDLYVKIPETLRKYILNDYLYYEFAKVHNQKYSSVINEIYSKKNRIQLFYCINLDPYYYFYMLDKIRMLCLFRHKKFRRIVLNDAQVIKFNDFDEKYVMTKKKSYDLYRYRGTFGPSVKSRYNGWTLGDNTIDWYLERNADYRVNDTEVIEIDNYKDLDFDALKYISNEQSRIAIEYFKIAIENNLCGTYMKYFLDKKFHDIGEWCTDDFYDDYKFADQYSK